ncbi:hypothetical protein ACLI1A_02450 [Flavobacterium sp. RHBU_3]|uniref:hypothetical protein n=1 Tax=Flavobacterium sp. RHBU_3 TaxID=3391184 RepID=UPI003984C451
MKSILRYTLISILLVSCTDRKAMEKTVECKIPKTPENEIPSCFWAKKIQPDKHYDYWAYVGYNLNYFYDKPIIKEAGDTLYRKYTLQKPPNLGFFHGCHPNFCSQFIIAVKNKKVRYIDTELKLRDFLGTIDNIEEALLYAASFNYYNTGNHYRVVNGNYQFNANKYSTYGRVALPSEKITITKDGFIKTERLIKAR